MSLWHMDWKQLSNGRWWIAVMDDASRLIMNYGVFQTATAEHTIHVLKQAIDKHGCPHELLTDRGSQFYANESERREKGVRQFTAYLEGHGIEHIMGSIGKPTTQGKIERFFQTFELYYPRFNDLNRFREYYNNKPHRSLNYKTPAQVYLN
jgi:transposase InsO family protein